MGEFYVVTLEHGDPLAERGMFHFLGRQLAQKSMERIFAIARNNGGKAPSDLEYAEMFTFGECLPGYEDKLPEWVRFSLPTVEYKKFAKVYFLNEVAYRMYLEGGVEFSVAKIIPEDELPAGRSNSLKCPYLSTVE